MESTLNIREFLTKLKKRVPLIILVTILFIAVSGLISYTIIKPVYQASTQILISQNNSASSEPGMQDINTNLQLINTYNVILQSPVILSGVIEELDLNETVQSLTDRITVSNIENAQVVTISVEDQSLENAVLIANTTASVFQEKIQSLMKVDNVSILAPAELIASTEPLKPDPLFNMAIGAVLGFMVGTGLAILLDQLNTTIRTEEDIEEIVGLQVLGIVSPFRAGKEMKKPAGKYIRKELNHDVENEKVQTAGSAKIGGTF